MLQQLRWVFPVDVRMCQFVSVNVAQAMSPMILIRCPAWRKAGIRCRTRRSPPRGRRAASISAHPALANSPVPRRSRSDCSPRAASRSRPRAPLPQNGAPSLIEAHFLDSSFIGGFAAIHDVLKSGDQVHPIHSWPGRKYAHSARRPNLSTGQRTYVRAEHAGAAPLDPAVGTRRERRKARGSERSNDRLLAMAFVKSCSSERPRAQSRKARSAVMNSLWCMALLPRRRHRSGDAHRRRIAIRPSWQGIPNYGNAARGRPSLLGPCLGGPVLVHARR